jgi:hypothetical protein
MAGYGTLEEVKYKWSIDDIFDSLEILDIIEENERKAHGGKT